MNYVVYFTHTSQHVLPLDETAVISKSKSFPIISPDSICKKKEKQNAQNSRSEVGGDARNGKFMCTYPDRQLSSELQPSS